jgi:hypothetical protein
VAIKRKRKKRSLKLIIIMDDRIGKEGTTLCSTLNKFHAGREKEVSDIRGR